MNFLCIAGHDFGEMLFDENKNAYKICRRCGKRKDYRPRLLSDIDKMTLEEVNKMMGGTEELTFKNIPEIGIQPDPPKCPNCNAVLEIVEPQILMDNMKLMECPNCKERCYK